MTERVVTYSALAAFLALYVGLWSGLIVVPPDVREAARVLSGCKP